MPVSRSPGLFVNMKKSHEIKKSHATSLPINPRYGVPAISWSDLVAIESNVERWYKTVTGAHPKLKNDSMRYGTVVHDQVRRRKLKGIPCGNDPEKILSCVIKDGKQSFTVIGKPDDVDEETIYEYKTGLKLWSRGKAENHGQLKTYAMLRMKATGKCPKRALLVSLGTVNDEDAGIVLTGETRVIAVPISKVDVLKIQSRFVLGYRKAIRYIDSIER